MIILEFIGMICSIVAVLFIATATNKNIYKANILFYISNISLLTFFMLNGIISIFIQMCFFYITAILGILRLSNNKKRDLKLIITTTTIYFILLIIYLYNNSLINITFTLKPLDAMASLFAIIGSYLLAFDNYIKRNLAYTLFIIADILYVYIGYNNNFIFFTIQSFFFIFTSTFGIINNYKIFNKINIINK